MPQDRHGNELKKGDTVALYFGGEGHKARVVGLIQAPGNADLHYAELQILSTTFAPTGSLTLDADPSAPMPAPPAAPTVDDKAEATTEKPAEEKPAPEKPAPATHHRRSPSTTTHRKSTTQKGK